MKKFLICLLAVLSISCHPDVINDNKDIVETPVTEETTGNENDNDNITGGLEDPVENPEQEW